MKRVIVTSILLWFLISVILLIFLLVKVFVLEKQVSILASNQATLSQFAEDYAAYQNAVVRAISETEVNEEPKAGLREPTVETAVLDEENLAGPEDVHKVYLTFDDGPSQNTEAILDILKECDVKATFFVIGKEDEESEAAYKRIVEEGHTLGMHSFSHKYSTIYDSLAEFKADFYRLQRLLEKKTGVKSEFYRFPGSSVNQVSNTEMDEFTGFLNTEGVTWFDWNVSSGDATTQTYTKEELVENVVNDVEKYKTSIVLLHDSDAKGTTVDALKPMIEALKEKGCVLLPIDETTYHVQYAAPEEETEMNEN
ncbi:MAG: polysaccharide deacetylase [Lachnospiraceae bacterium]|nr:polysaccharide deacetylase [Lachnospiraceae bacterium]